MDIILIIAIIMAFGVIGFIYYDKQKQKKYIEKIGVSYSEQVGESIIEHGKTYTGLLNYKEDIFKIPEINKILPIPPSETFIPTITGGKKIYLIKIDSYRFGFRVPNLSNTVYIQERDQQGNLIKVNGKPKLKKHIWRYCDDVVEPDVKHWDENIMEKLKQKHRTRSDMLSKWIAPIIVGMILVAGIVSIHMVTKYSGERLDKAQTIAAETMQKAKENTGLINNLIKKVEERD